MGLTVDDLIAMRRKINETMSVPHNDLVREQPFTFMGMKVIEHPICAPQPKLKLSDTCRELVGRKFADEMDAWLLEQFGLRTEERAFLVAGSLALAPGRLKSIVSLINMGA